MHSRIFQVSVKPIEACDYLRPQSLYDCSSDFADYIGDAIKGEQRKADINSLSAELASLFELDSENDVLVFKGLGSFLEDWAALIREEAKHITAENISCSRVLNGLRSLCDNTHIYTDCRFYIKGWSDCADPLSELIRYCKIYLKQGQRLYVGSVIDYHY